jgi:hypothetical protein
VPILDEIQYNVVDRLDFIACQTSRGKKEQILSCQQHNWHGILHAQWHSAHTPNVQWATKRTEVELEGRRSKPCFARGHLVNVQLWSILGDKVAKQVEYIFDVLLGLLQILRGDLFEGSQRAFAEKGRIL